MTDFRVGDIVKITQGKEGKPGYSAEIATVAKGYPCKKDEIPISEVEQRLEDSRVTVLGRVQKYRTALVGDDTEPVLVSENGLLIDSNYTLRSLSKLGEEEVFIETCPYVPEKLIEEAEAWLEVCADRESRNPSDILADIVKAVRKYRGD